MTRSSLSLEQCFSFQVVFSIPSQAWSCRAISKQAMSRGVPFQGLLTSPAC